jgi:histidinol dehydrogenase
MPALRRFDVDELLTRPGTYFNPETEIVLIVDDSAHVDLELIEDEEDDEAAEWILLGDDPAIDEHKRDELVEAFETRRARSAAREDPDEDEVDEEDDLEPDPDDEY